MGPAAPAMAVVSGIYGIYSGMQQSKEASKAASKQEALARTNAANIESETREEARRVQKAGDEALAEGRAKAAASGTRGTGSQNIFLGSEEDELNREIDWLNTAGGNRADLALKSGKNAADVTKQQGKTAGLGSAFKGATQAAGGVDNWNTGYQGSTKTNKTWWDY